MLANYPQHQNHLDASVRYDLPQSQTPAPPALHDPRMDQRRGDGHLDTSCAAGATGHHSHVAPLSHAQRHSVPEPYADAHHNIGGPCPAPDGDSPGKRKAGRLFWA